MATSRRTTEKPMGRPPKLLDHKLFSLRLPTPLHRALRTYVSVKGGSINDLLIEIIAKWWREQPEYARIEALVAGVRKTD